MTAATVDYLWTGLPTPDGIIATAKLNVAGTAVSVRLAISTSPDLTGLVYSAAVAPDATYRLAKMTMAGLLPSTQYYYGVEVDGTLDVVTVGKFKTLPIANAPASFRFAFGSCASTSAVNNAAFDAINALATRPLFTLTIGDFHYGDIYTANPACVEADYQAAYDVTFASAARHTFQREMPSPMIWDDHDFAGDNISGVSSSGASRPCRAPAIASFRRRVPVPQASAVDDTPVYYSFVAGRVRFVVSDLRSDRINSFVADTAAKTMMGVTQKAWWKDQISAAKAAHQVVAWVSSSPYHGAPSFGYDAWWGFPNERAELADYIKAQGMALQTFILAGDMHALAVAAAADYATGGGCPLPVLHSSPFNKAASTKGGPYSLGPYPAAGSAVTQSYGLVDVADDGITVTITYNGYTADGQLRVTFSKAFPPTEPRFQATGGVQTKGEDGYTYWTFTANGVLNVTSPGVAEYLVVGGGASGRRSGSSKAGGGAGGGPLRGTAAFAVGAHAVTIGNGGVAATGSNTGDNGSSSYLGALRGYGGGRGGSASTAPLTGSSGGGGGADGTQAKPGAASTVAGQGFKGGDGKFSATPGLAAAGGGGGAGGGGQDGNNANGKGGDGGPGVEWPPGSGKFYGGGGGGSGGTSQGLGGIGGGTAGALAADAADAAPNTGGGGGGEGDSSAFIAGDGGSGIVIIRAPTRREARSTSWFPLAA